MVSMILGFGAVAYIDYEYQTNGNTVLLWESDSDATPFLLTFGDSYTAFPGRPYDYQTQQWGYVSPAQQYTYNRTAVYTGNDTWSMSVNSTGFDHNYARQMWALPDLPSWIIESVNITTTLAGDSDMAIGVGILHLTPITEVGDTTEGTVVYSDALAGGVTDKIIAADVDLNTALRIYDYSNVVENTALGIEISVRDQDNDGWTGWSWVTNIEIYGQTVSEWSVSDSIYGALGGATILNLFVAAYMTDKIDLGGFTKVLKGKKEW